VFKEYYILTKPGIIRGNLITAAAGFFLASKSNIDIFMLTVTLAGIAMVIASGCVYNNYIDRGIDKKMKRTKNRALVSGTISSQSALTFGTLLGVAGFTTLALWTNQLTVFIGIVGFVFYVAVYGFWKRRSTLGTVIGSVSGAIPPVAGYTAVTNNIDEAAVLLFLILALWQMPHFYSIAMYRAKEYAAAAVPVLPVVKGMRLTKIYILLYITAFMLTAPLLTAFGYTGYLYMVIATFLGFSWLWQGIRGLNEANDVRWAKSMFRYSLLVITILSITISFAAVLP
jgi:protoheme IX farnesyltransferase